MGVATCGEGGVAVMQEEASSAHTNLVPGLGATGRSREWLGGVLRKAEQWCVYRGSGVVLLTLDAW